MADIKLNVDLQQGLSNTNKLVEVIEKLSQSVDQLGQKMNATGDTTTKTTKKVAKGFKEINAELLKTNDEYKENKRRVDELRKASGKYTKEQLRELSRLHARQKDIRDGYVKAGNAGADAMKKVNRQVSIGRQLFLRLRSVMLTVFGAYAIIQGVRNTTSAIAKFELGMARVGAITNATAEDLEKLTKTAIKTSSSGIFSPAKIAEVQVVLAKLGFTVDEIGSSIKSISDLSLATGEDLVVSSELVASTLRGLGLEASKTRHVVDVMGKSFTTSALDVTKYKESMKFLAPIIRNMGWELEDATSILGVLADNMISGSLAGTGTRQMLIELADASSDANKVLGRQIKTFDDFLDFLDKLKASGAGLNEAVNLFNKRSATAVVSLIENSDRLREYRGELDSTSGAIQEMADRIRGELIPASQDLNASWQAWLNSTAGTGGLADSLNNIKSAIDAVTLANINNIRTWNTASEFVSNYIEQWKSFWSGKGFSLRALFVNDAFDDLQVRMNALDENIVLLTSDYGKFFDRVKADTRSISDEETRALERIKFFSTELSDVYVKVNEREVELRDNIEKRKSIIEELQRGGLSDSEKTALLDELDQLRIRSVEIETLISFYKNIRKELSDEISTNLVDVDIEALKSSFETLNKTYNSFSDAVKNSPVGAYLRGQLFLYQKAIRDILGGDDELVEELTSEQIAALRKLLSQREQYELEIAEATLNGFELEKAILDIKHKYRQKNLDLDLKIYKDDAEAYQNTLNLMASDTKKYITDVTALKTKYSEEELDRLKKDLENQIKIIKINNDKEVELLKNNDASKADIKRKEIQLEIELLEWTMKRLKLLGVEGFEIDELAAKVSKLKAEFAGIADEDLTKELIDNISKQIDVYKRLADAVIDAFDSIVDAQVENTSRLVDDLDTRISETQSALNQEIQLYAAGYANNVTAKKEELAQLEAARNEAMIKREAAIRRQQQLEAISQSINLFSAVAKVINTYANIPLAGPLIAAGVVASFLGLYATAQNQIRGVTQFEEGGEVKGNSHANGGVVLEAEGGEFIVRKSAYAKYAPLINAINEDNLPTLDATVLSNTTFDKGVDVVVDNKIWNKMYDLWDKNLNGERVEIVGNRKIITRGKHKRIIKDV